MEEKIIREIIVVIAEISHVKYIQIQCSYLLGELIRKFDPTKH